MIDGREKTTNAAGGVMEHILADFGQNFLNEDVCRRWLIERLLPGGVFCPHCQHPVVGRQLVYYLRNTRQNICTRCNRKFSLFKGTELHATKLSVSEIVLIAFLTQLGQSPSTIAGRIHRQPLAIRKCLDKLDAARDRIEKEQSSGEH